MSTRRLCAVVAIAVLALLVGLRIGAPEPPAGSERAAPGTQVVSPRPDPPAAPDASSEVADRPDRPWLLLVRVLGPDGRPVEHASLVLLDPAGARVARVSTDAGGAGGLEPIGSGRLAVFPPGPLAPHLDAELLERPPGGELRREIRLERGLEIEGMLLDQDGAPVEMGKVVARSLDPGSWTESAHRSVLGGRITWRRPGRFRLVGLLPGAHRLSARFGGSPGDDAFVPPVVAEAGARNVVLRCDPSRIVMLRFVDADTGAPVTVGKELFRMDGPRRYLSGAGGAETGVRLRPGETGRYLVRTLGYEDRAFELTARETTRDQREVVRLRPDPEGPGRIELTVRDPRGVPVERVELCRPVRGRDGTLLRRCWNGEERTAPGGVVALRVAPGEHRLKVGPARPRPLFLLDTELTVRVRRGETVRREVVLPEGGALRVVDATGGRRFRNRALPPGPLDFTERMPDGRPIHRMVEIRPGEITEVESARPPPAPAGATDAEGWAR